MSEIVVILIKWKKLTLWLTCSTSESAFETILFLESQTQGEHWKPLESLLLQATDAVLSSLS